MIIHTLVPPLQYIRFMNRLVNSIFFITDSGGIQEETTYIGIPCLTLRPNTERPITVEQCTNQLCTVDKLEHQVDEILNELSIQHSIPDLLGGHTARRVIASIKEMR